MLDPLESKTGKYGVLSLRTPPASPTSTAGGADSAFESSDVLDDEESLDARRRGGYITDDTTRSLWSGRMSAPSLGGSGEVASSRRGLVSAATGNEELPTSGRKGVNYRVQDVVVRMRKRAHGRPTRLWSGIKRGVVARYQAGRKVWPYMISMALVYMVTLSLFPGIESRIVSCRLGTWMPVLLMALFNAADFVGKVLASVRYDWSRSQLVWLSCSRVVLVPLLALCALPRWDAGSSSDLWAMFLSVALGVTNGLLGSLPMILAPGRVPDDQKELTGNIMTLSYSVGLTTGSGLAYLLVYLIQGYDFGGPNCDENFPARLTSAALNETTTSWSTTVNSLSSLASVGVNTTRHLDML
ncbi:uncharacterized protein LOC119452752 [Dermacentor silvarum]|uniref:uncharacterized protein LOC119452752 n=1 Tax=Dermacentor silvarum TaxID=543639 RepID=UPI00210149E7|nr:uncharacterized protein LOC119452752 [Dermacentor silvarum]